jgi:MBG domain-containing protein/YDG domain-containing protein
MLTHGPLPGSVADIRVSYRDHWETSASLSVTTRDLTGLVGDDVVSLVGGSAAFDTKNTGAAKTVTLTGATLSGADAGNYTLESVATATADITSKPITVKADDKTKVYGSADPALTVTVPNGALESGDSLSGSLVRAAGKDVGSYAITKGSLTAGGNYDLTVTPGVFKITTKTITVTADDKTKVVGAADPALTYKVTSGSLESGDSFSGALTRARGETIGSYAITQGTLTAGGNYALTFVGSALKIVYGWDGFLQPINDTAHQTGVQQSKFKLGQTIPAKFVLKNAAGAVVRQATDPTFTRSGNLGACDNTAAPDTTEAVTADAGSTFTWDGSQYHYNWSTKNLTAGEYRIYANLADGTKQYVDICLAK